MTTRPDKPEPVSFTVTVIVPNGFPDVTIFGPFDTEDAATGFAEQCDALGMVDFHDVDPSTVAYARVLPVYRPTIPAVSYYFPGE